MAKFWGFDRYFGGRSFHKIQIPPYKASFKTARTMIFLKMLAKGLVGLARGLTKHVLNYPNSPVPMRKDDCSETDNLTGRSMPLRLISDTNSSFLGHFRVGNGKNMTGITMDKLCFSVRDHSLEEIDRTCRNKSLFFLR